MTAKKVKITDDDVLKVVIADLQMRLDEKTKDAAALLMHGEMLNGQLEFQKGLNESLQKEVKTGLAFMQELKEELERIRQVGLDLVKEHKGEIDKLKIDLSTTRDQLIIQRNDMCEASNKSIADYKERLQLEVETVIGIEAKLKDMTGRYSEESRRSAYYAQQLSDERGNVIKQRIRGNYKSLFWGSIMLLLGYLSAILIHYSHAH